MTLEKMVLCVVNNFKHINFIIIIIIIINISYQYSDFGCASPKKNLTCCQYNQLVIDDKTISFISNALFNRQKFNSWLQNNDTKTNFGILCFW